MKQAFILLTASLFLIASCSIPRTETPADAPTVETGGHLDYLKHIELRDVGTGRNESGAAGVFGEVKNAGNRTVVSLRLRALLLDENGDAVSEQDYQAIVAERYRAGDSEPLKPNYSRKFAFPVSAAPADWSGKVKLSVLDVQISE